MTDYDFYEEYRESYNLHKWEEGYDFDKAWEEHNKQRGMTSDTDEGVSD